ncbi:class I SAM-dependent methyltransferase [Isoptericola sp. NEAU-Y5]|uniref:Class I SAM-dependent methyltransferase n=1 Tax=Isoptericola luteus TaxID=2879484 RepID=A0ABS7ZET5_9MICO|nr:class I SAM-dependent methyltransferase [Isoptericola sp. NEAU-Y5]MCA5893558.1 class I SAM-dependent methyltransferase [Isoptericola sp. NEAU-Y5]
MTSSGPVPPPLSRAGYQDVPDAQGGGAARGWWDANAAEYLDEHGDFLGAATFRWGPEGLTEDEAGLLGDVAGAAVLEVGAGAAQCSRWLATRGARVVASDVSGGMLAGGDRLDAAAGVVVPRVQADARALPFADEAFDVVFTSFGAIPFVPDARRVHAEAARVLRPGGRWVFSVTHPVRWAFPDDPTARGLIADRSYFDRRPYAESDDDGRVTYAEYHRTLGDHVRDVVAAGLRLRDVVEPEWPGWNDQVWGGWSPERGALLPGTAVFVTTKD